MEPRATPCHEAPPPPQTLSACSQLRVLCPDSLVLKSSRTMEMVLCSRRRGGGRSHLGKEGLPTWLPALPRRDSLVFASACESVPRIYLLRFQKALALRGFPNRRRACGGFLITLTPARPVAELICVEAEIRSRRPGGIVTWMAALNPDARVLNPECGRVTSGKVKGKRLLST